MKYLSRFLLVIVLVPVFLFCALCGGCGDGCRPGVEDGPRHVCSPCRAITVGGSMVVACKCER